MLKRIHVGGVPVALRDLGSYFESEIQATELFIATNAQAKMNLQSAVVTSSGIARGRLLEAIDACEHAMQMGEEQLQVLRAASREVVRGKPAMRLQQYGLNQLSYLRTDWCNTPEGEKQIATIEGVVRPLIEKYAARDENALMLGAGTGRLAVDLAGMFKHLTAIERCFAYVYLFHRLREDPVDFYIPAFNAPMRSDRWFPKCQARFLADPKDLDRLSFMVADAREVPLESNSVSTVLSIYFTDVLPVSEFFREVNRVLRRGGTFIHFGPLHYHFFDRQPAAAYPPDELLEVLRSFNYDLVDEASFEMPFLQHSDEGKYSIHRVWSWVLKRR